MEFSDWKAAAWIAQTMGTRQEKTAWGGGIYYMSSNDLLSTIFYIKTNLLLKRKIHSGVHNRRK